MLYSSSCVPLVQLARRCLSMKSVTYICILCVCCWGGGMPYRCELVLMVQQLLCFCCWGGGRGVRCCWFQQLLVGWPALHHACCSAAADQHMNMLGPTATNRIQSADRV
jgi:hypothetical protein